MGLFVSDVGGTKNRAAVLWAAALATVGGAAALAAAVLLLDRASSWAAPSR